MVALDPLGRAGDNGSRHLVTFCREAGRRRASRGGDRRAGGAVAVHGREIYSWHPNGLHGSELAKLLVAQEAWRRRDRTQLEHRREAARR